MPGGIGKSRKERIVAIPGGTPPNSSADRMREVPELRPCVARSAMEFTGESAALPVPERCERKQNDGEGI